MVGADALQAEDGRERLLEGPGDAGEEDVRRRAAVRATTTMRGNSTSG